MAKPATKNKAVKLVKVGNVRLEIRQISGRWRFEWDEGGRRRMVSSVSEDIAVRRAHKKAQELAGGLPDFAEIPQDIARGLAEILKQGPTADDLRDAAQWLRGRKGSGATLGDVTAAFVAAKHKARALSDRWPELVAWASKRLLDHFGHDRRMDSITPTELSAWLDTSDLAPRTRKTLRDFAASLFRWAVLHGHLPEGKSAGEKLAPVRVIRKTPETLEPAELAKALRACDERHIPWLVLSAFGLLRQAELYASGDKSPLTWEDLLWEQGSIRVRPETAKTGRKRIAPLHPVVVRWLAPLRGAGPICVGKPPHKSLRPGAASETARLAAAMGRGSWPANVLRHSAISYRAAAVGLSVTAHEAGNSEAESRRSYNDAKTPADAEIWFSLTPEAVGRDWPDAVPFALPLESAPVNSR